MTPENDGKYNPLRPELIAIDFDGTLLSPTGVVTPRTVAAVHRAVAAGLKVCFATGRNWTESRAIVDVVGHRGLAVFVGGAAVVDTADGRILKHALMQPQLAADVCRFFESHGQAAMALQDTGAAGVDYLITERAEIGHALGLWMRMTKAAYTCVPNLADLDHRHTIRVSVVNDVTMTAKLSDGLTAEFGDRVVFHSVAVPSHGVDVLEVFDPAVNKWNGLLVVAAELGIDPAAIVAIGDDINDLPMLRAAGLGVAMGNGRPEAKAAAKRVIGSNANDGLAAFLEELAADRERNNHAPA